MMNVETHVITLLVFQPVMKPMDIFGFPPIFWLLSVICLAYYAAIFPFISLGQVFFMKKFQYDKANANMINGK